MEPHEERRFFDGYGDVAVDTEAIVFYRYERILEDIGEFAASVFLDTSLTEAAREEQTAIVESFSARGGIMDTAERVERAPDR